MATLFSHLLVLATLLTGLGWAIEHFFLRPKREQKLEKIKASSQIELTQPTVDKVLQESWLAENCRAMFPVLAIVLIFRSFIYEPFQIPSGSMKPTLLVGDFLLVEKFAYGLRDPVWRHKFLETGQVERGDVVVFKYPLQPSIDYIKRVVGLPGDSLVYRDKELYLRPACRQGVFPCPEFRRIEREPINVGEFTYNGTDMARYREDLQGVEYDILINPLSPEWVSNPFAQPGLGQGEWIIPEGHYFAMGDNRDHSADSRYWGFIAEEHLVGKATVVWISFEFNRSEASLIPSFIPSGVRFNRIGKIQ